MCNDGPWPDSPEECCHYTVILGSQVPPVSWPVMSAMLCTLFILMNAAVWTSLTQEHNVYLVQLEEPAINEHNTRTGYKQLWMYAPEQLIGVRQNNRQCCQLLTADWNLFTDFIRVSLLLYSFSLHFFVSLYSLLTRLLCNSLWAPFRGQLYCCGGRGGETSQVYVWSVGHTDKCVQ